MGFEVVFHYCEWDKDGYDRDKTKEMKKKIGDPFEVIEDTNLASTIMAQMARRDILVVDVEIYELTKKQVSFAPSKGGVKIRNKNYSFDFGNVIAIESHEDAKEGEAREEGPRVEQEEVQPKALPTKKPLPNTAEALKKYKKPIREEVFDPEPFLLRSVKERGLAFTIGKTYPVYQEKPASLDNPLAGMAYVTIDDKGEKQVINDKHFVPKSKGLIGQDDSQGPPPEIPLSYGSIIEGDVPDIRRIK